MMSSMPPRGVADWAHPSTCAFSGLIPPGGSPAGTVRLRRGGGCLGHGSVRVPSASLRSAPPSEVEEKCGCRWCQPITLRCCHVTGTLLIPQESWGSPYPEPFTGCGAPIEIHRRIREREWATILFAYITGVTCSGATRQSSSPVSLKGAARAEIGDLNVEFSHEIDEVCNDPGSQIGIGAQHIPEPGTTDRQHPEGGLRRYRRRSGPCVE